jgi:hypothetical protein
VVVEIGIPQRRATGEWACPYRISGLGQRRIGHAFGIDPVQALQLVQQAIWRDLKPHERELSWLGTRGLTGFYRFYSVPLSQAHVKRVEAAIDREVARETRRLQQLVMKKRRAAKRRGR